MTKKYLVFPAKNRVELAETPLSPPPPGQLLVQTTRTMISTGTECIVLSGNYSPGTHWDRWVKFPFCPGYLHTGRVVEVGRGVGGWQPGDRVASRATHESHSLLQAEHAVRIPASVRDDDAAWMGLGKITQIGVRAAEHRMGDVVVVVGLGLLGQLVVQYVRLMGTSRIIAIDRSTARLKMAEAHGATPLACSSADALPAVLESTEGRGADVVYDVTGHHAVFPTVLPLARKFGTVVLLGDSGTPNLQTLTGDVVSRGLKIVGAHDTHSPDQATDHVRWTSKQMYGLFLHYLSTGQMRLSDLITHRYQPADAPQAYAMLQTARDQAMGVLFEWS